MGRVARLMPRVLCLEGAILAREGHQEVAVVDELIARVVGHGGHARVQTDGVAGASLDAIAAEDAAELVDDELDGVSLVAATRVALRVFPCFDVDALRG